MRGFPSYKGQRNAATPGTPAGAHLWGLADETRDEDVESGWAKLVGTDPELIVGSATSVLGGDWVRPDTANPSSRCQEG